MKNNKKKIAVSVVAAILLVLLYLLIFAFSGQDGEESGSLSSMISEKCAELLNAISGKHWTQNVIDSMAAYFEHPIRKLAHFSEYACMGVLLYGVWRPWKERTRKLYLLIVLWVFVSAGADALFSATVLPPAENMIQRARHQRIPILLRGTAGEASCTE